MGKTQSSTAEIIVLDTETTSANAHEAKLLAISMSDGKTHSFIDNPEVTYNDSFKGKLVGHNIKYDLTVLRRHGLSIKDAYFDTMICYYLLHIDKSRKLENAVKDLFNVNKDDLLQVYNKSTGETRKTLPADWYEKVSKNDLATYAMADVEWTYSLYEKLNEELDNKPELKQWFFEVEMPLVNLLTRMEMKGVRINRLKMTQLKEELTIKAKDLKGRLNWLSGQPDLNLNSPKQLRELFKKFHLPQVGYTPSGESATDKNALKKLADLHAFPKTLLEYREIEKILSTYTDSILDKLDKNDRLHTCYNQALTHTRRFSSDHPNLQNIPTRSILGKKIKECFIPDNGHIFLIADYSQLEPRILAHLSGDKVLCNIYNNNEDIYLRAVDICKTKGFTITRDQTKTLMLAIMYGKTPYGLAKDYNCSEQEAAGIINAIVDKLTGVKEYLIDCEHTALKTGGWLKTISGLPLYIGNPYTNSKSEYAQIMRCAANYPIQGSSQDILKKAMVNISQEYGILPVLMVHDELVYELPKDSPIVLDEDIQYAMENAWKLKVPLKIEAKIEEKWTK